MPIEELEESKYFDCACHSDEHTLKFAYMSDDKKEYREVYTSVFLYQYHSFFVRLWHAIKYTFGYKCKYGDFDCFILREKDLDKLIDLLQKYKADMGKPESAGQWTTVGPQGNQGATGSTGMSGKPSGPQDGTQSGPQGIQETSGPQAAQDTQDVEVAEPIEESPENIVQNDDTPKGSE
jgi:hypothetical protein